jgi:diacylglycerol O-acyltransferase 1
MSQTGAFVLSFFISAVFHEVIISVPFRAFRLWAFLGMMMQVPLIWYTRRLQGNQTGNVLFWVSITLGQPLSVLMYYRDYIVLQQQSTAAAVVATMAQTII